MSKDKKKQLQVRAKLKSVRRNYSSGFGDYDHYTTNLSRDYNVYVRGTRNYKKSRTGR